MNNWNKIKSSIYELYNGKYLAIVEKSRGMYWGKCYVDVDNDNSYSRYMFTFPPKRYLKDIKAIIENNKYFSKNSEPKPEPYRQEEKYSRTRVYADPSEMWWNKV